MPTRRNPPAKWVLPGEVDPPARRCYLIQVPDEQAHIGAFFGALYNLTSARFWQDDPTHLAKDVAAVWQDIYDQVIQQDCTPSCAIPIAESDYDMSICEQLRFQNGRLQGLCCGVWEDISGQTTLPVGGQSQPGTGNTIPTGGQCASYHAEFIASNRWLLPVVVNTGDTLTFTNAQGAADDGALGSFSAWHCPDGGLFFGGLNIGGKSHGVGDPSASLFHMQLMLVVNGAYYDASQGTVTIPGGVVNAIAYLTVNDATITDDGGDFSVDIAYCNNQAASWSRFLDFTKSPYGFINVPLAGYTPALLGVWTAGVGWQNTTAHQATPEYFRSVDIKLTVTSFTITRMEVFFSMTKGAFFGVGETGLQVASNAGNAILLANPNVPSAANQDLAGNVAGAAQTLLTLYAACASSSPTDTTSGSVTITGLRVFGTGPVPPELGSAF